MPTPKTSSSSTSVSAASTTAAPSLGLGSSSGTPSTTPAPAATVLSAPPTMTIPAPPVGFTPVALVQYRGYHPKTGQLASATDTVLELRSFSAYDSVFGGLAPSAASLADEIDDGVQWTSLRLRAEALVEYLKSGEVVAWKQALADLDKLGHVANLVLAKNPDALDACPSLVRMLQAPKVIARAALATKARKAKAAKPNGPVVEPTTSGTTASAVATPVTGLVAR